VGRTTSGRSGPRRLGRPRARRPAPGGYGVRPGTCREGKSENGVAVMEHEEASELLAAFALGALAGPEQEAVAAHARQCVTCRRELAGLRGAVAALPLSLPPAEPSPALRERILGAVGAGGRRSEARPRALVRLVTRTSSGWLAAAALFLATLGFGGWGLTEYQQLRSQPRVTLAGTAAAATAQGTVALAPGQAPTVYVAHLAAPPADHVYEAWVIHAGVPAPAGIFVTAAGGNGGLVLTRQPTAGDQVVITLEPAPGGAKPTGPAVLQGVFSA
jgi:anti-sigma-K factor RskA